MEKMASVVSEVNTAVQGVRQLLKEERKGGTSATAARHCQALYHSVQQLLQTVEQYRNTRDDDDSSTGSIEIISDLLCVCFQTSSQVLSLCKEVEAGSSWLFDDLSSHLALLFKTTFTLIKVSTELLDKLTLNQDTFEKVVSSLRLLCPPILNFDPSLPVLVWRGLGKTLCRGKNVINVQWNIQPIICDICIAMETKTVECIRCVPRDNKLADGIVGTSEGEGSSVGCYVKLLKLCRFLSSLLVKLIQEFHDNCVECSDVLVNLLIHLYRSVPPSPYCESVNRHTQAELESNILLVCEPVFSALMDSTQFLRCLLSSSTIDEKENGCGFGRLLCLALLLKYFPKLSDGFQDFVMESVTSRENHTVSCLFLDTIFTTIAQCDVELELPVRLPGIMCNGQPQSEVSLYDHLLTHFFSFISCLPHHLFPILEAVLFHHALSSGSSNVFSVLLAVDGIIYIARCEQRLAERYANLLAQLLQRDSSDLNDCVYQTVYMILSRIVKLMSPTQQTMFIETHPPLHHQLWSHIDLIGITESIRGQVAQELVSSSVEQITIPLQTGIPDLPSLHWSLECLHGVSSHLPSSHTHHSTIITTLTQTWDWLVKQHNTFDKWSAVVVCDCIAVLADYISLLPPNTLLKVFGPLKDMIDSKLPPPTSVCMTMADFLGKCGCLNIPSNIQTSILHNLVFLFQHLLCHSNWLVLHQTLCAFRDFVKCTPYGSTAEECVLPHLNDIVVDFLQQIPYLTSSLSDMRSTSFWVQALKKRTVSVGRWRQGEVGSEGRREMMIERSNESGHPKQDHDSDSLVATKVQLLLDTWHELCTLALPYDGTCVQQLRDLCTSIQSHLSACSSPITPDQHH